MDINNWYTFDMYLLEKLVLHLIQNTKRKQHMDLLQSWEITYNLEF